MLSKRWVSNDITLLHIFSIYCVRIINTSDESICSLHMVLYSMVTKFNMVGGHKCAWGVCHLLVPLIHQDKHRKQCYCWWSSYHGDCSRPYVHACRRMTAWRYLMYRMYKPSVRILIPHGSDTILYDTIPYKVAVR